MTWKLKAEAVEVQAMKRGMNLSDVARLAGISQGTIYAAMGGKRKPTLKTIAKLAETLQVEVQDIAERIEEERGINFD